MSFKELISSDDSKVGLLASANVAVSYADALLPWGQLLVALATAVYIATKTVLLIKNWNRKRKEKNEG